MIFKILVCSLPAVARVVVMGRRIILYFLVLVATSSPHLLALSCLAPKRHLSFLPTSGSGLRRRVGWGMQLHPAWFQTEPGSWESTQAEGYDLYSAYDYTIPPVEEAIRHSDSSSFWVLWKSSSTFWLGCKTLRSWVS